MKADEKDSEMKRYVDVQMQMLVEGVMNITAQGSGQLRQEVEVHGAQFRLAEQERIAQFRLAEQGRDEEVKKAAEEFN